MMGNRISKVFLSGNAITSCFGRASGAAPLPGSRPLNGISENGTPKMSTYSAVRGECMGRDATRATCEGCQSIDVLRLHRDGWLRPGSSFPWSPWYGHQSGAIQIRAEIDGVLLMFRAYNLRDHSRIELDQRVPVVWTDCALGGKRPWFVCTSSRRGRYCERRVVKLYLRYGSQLACRDCFGLAYASQQESPHSRAIGQARKIRMRLGGSENLRQPFPEKPPRMHWRTYWRWKSR